MLLHTFLYFSGPLKGFRPLFLRHRLRATVRLPRALVFHWHTNHLFTTYFFTSPPIAALFHAIALSVIPTHQIPPFPMTSQPLHPTWNALFIPQSASRWRSAHNSTLLSSTNIAQHYIPIVTAAPTFPIFYQKIHYSKIFWALSRSPVAFALIFEFLYSLHIRVPDIRWQFGAQWLHGGEIHLSSMEHVIGALLIVPCGVFR